MKLWKLIAFLVSVVSVTVLSSSHEGRAIIAAASASALGSVQPAGLQPGSLPQSVSPQRALLDRYCVTCHNEKLKTAGLTLDTADVAKVGEQAEVWEKVVLKLRGNQMPPAGRPRPDPVAYSGLLSWLETELDRAAAASPNPGRTESFHRLNRAEYRNVIRDLLALDIDVTSLLPADDASYGFDNIAGVLKINESVLEQYLSAAREISRSAVGSPLPAPTVHMVRIPDEVPQYGRVEGLPFGTRGGALIRYNFPEDGEYTIRANLSCMIPGECDGSAGFADTHQLEIAVDGERIQLFTLERHENEIMRDGKAVMPHLEVRLPVKAGPRDVGVAFLKLPSVAEVEARRQRLSRPLYLNGDNIILQEHAIYQPFLNSVTITGPFHAAGPGDTPSRRRIFVCRPASPADEAPCVKNILSMLARRAYRRPVTDEDVKELLTFYNDGRTEGEFETGIEMALRRLLVSPKFLFRIERDPANVAPNTVYRVSDLELAPRLSFFLWNSIPDDELLNVAIRGQLKDPKVLERQVRRMLADDRSQALTSNFLGQWLQLRNLDAVQPSFQLFPDFDGALRQAFRRETELFFDSILREDRRVFELLTANYTFLNERLALHYGIPNVYGPRFRRVTLSGENRRGLLGQGSILTVTSRPNRTSPVLRGKWILDTLLGTPPPPPIPNVPELEEKPDGSRKVLSMRERMAQHRKSPVCASCHAMIDPVGFALEHFDAVGRWRDVDEAFEAIDASGTLPDGTQFNDMAGFRSALLSRPELFPTTVTQKLLTYALGRGLEYYDMPAVRRIVREAAPNEFKLSSLIVGIARSSPFLMRRTQVPPSGVSASNR